MAEDTLLIVSGTPGDAERLSRPLRDRGIHPVVAVGVDEALRRSLTEDPTVVLLDADMPDADGFALCERIRTEVSESMPILMVSGSHLPADRSVNARVTAVVKEPFSVEVLGYELRRLRIRMRGITTSDEIRAMADVISDLDDDSVVEIAVDADAPLAASSSMQGVALEAEWGEPAPKPATEARPMSTTAARPSVPPSAIGDSIAESSAPPLPMAPRSPYVKSRGHPFGAEKPIAGEDVGVILENEIEEAEPRSARISKVAPAERPSSPRPELIARSVGGGDVHAVEPSQKGSIDMNKKIPSTASRLYSATQSDEARKRTAESFLDAAHLLALQPGREPVLCPHPSWGELKAMVRKRDEEHVTDSRLQRALWCSTCRVTLGLIKELVKD